MGRTNLFRLHEEDDPREITIRHESSIADAMFTPLGTCSVEAPLNLLMRDDDDIVSLPAARSRLTYRVAYGAASGRAPSGGQLRRMTATGIKVYVGGGEGGTALEKYGKDNWVTYCFTAGGTVLNALGSEPVPYLVALNLAAAAMGPPPHGAKT